MAPATTVPPVQLTAVLVDSPHNGEYRWSISLRKFAHRGERKAVRKELHTLQAQNKVRRFWLEGDVVYFVARVPSENARQFGQQIADRLAGSIQVAHGKVAAKLVARAASPVVIPQQKKRRTSPKRLEPVLP